MISLMLYVLQLMYLLVMSDAECVLLGSSSLTVADDGDSDVSDASDGDVDVDVDDDADDDDDANADDADDNDDVRYDLFC